jgi:hypothetical protein
MSERKVSSSSGIGFVGLLTIVFITLKLLGVINWNWGWVLAPLWISAITAAIVILIPIIAWVIARIFFKRDMK